MSAVFARRLHVALGFWVCGMVLIWAVTAIYFGFPDLFDSLFDLLDADPGDDVRLGDQALWPLVTIALLAPQRRAPDPDQNRPL